MKVPLETLIAAVPGAADAGPVAFKAEARVIGIGQIGLTGDDTDYIALRFPGVVDIRLPVTREEATLIVRAGLFGERVAIEFTLAMVKPKPEAGPSPVAT